MDFDNIYTPNETYRLTQTAQGRNYHLIKAFDFANYFQSDYWHYSNREDLLKSAQPVANATKCLQHLAWLEHYLNQSEKVLFKPGEQHINLMTLVDSFGHPETATYAGHGYWFGSYGECLGVSIDMRQFEREECSGNDAGSSSCLNNNDQKQQQQQQQLHPDDKLKFRYCIGKARDVDWPRPEQDSYVPRISYKVGLCLPETCETLSFATHSKQIERLMRLNMPQYMKERIELHDLYCLPDSRSPLRELSLASKVFLALCLVWLLALAAATITYSFYKRQQRDIRDILIAEQVAAHSCTGPAPEDALIGHKLESIQAELKLATANGDAKLASCAIVPNCCVEVDNKCNNALANSKLLLQVQTKALADEPFSLANTVVCPVQQRQDVQAELNTPTSFTYRSSSASLSNWLNDSPTIIKILQALSIKETAVEFTQPPELLRQPGATKRLRINLNALDAIKCLCCVLVIFGHIVFIHMQHLSNIIHTIELSNEVYPRALVAFFNFVDTFFIISGMLTAYFVFKRFNERSFSNPAVWLYISLMRLLRLSPVYILVLWYIKTLSVHISHGPIWDYGTDKNSIKGLCINDHWWKSILYFGNVGTMQPLCILPAWSIIVDSQYSLVIPPILFVIFKHRRLGYLLLLLATIISTTKMSIQLANQTAVKTSDMSKIRLHVYPLISRFAAEFYNTAWNRIGPVAIGIVGGHLLYKYDTGAIRRWPWFMRGQYFKVVLFLHIVIFLLPLIGRITDDPMSTNETDTTIFILSNASIKPIWSIINTIFLLRLISDLRSHSFLARLMSHNVWHCLGKLCFTSYLIHYEIILTLLKSRQEGLIDPNWSNALREFSAAFLISTLISYFIYILYEAPINKLITLCFLSHKNGSNRSPELPQEQSSKHTDEQQVVDDLVKEKNTSRPMEDPFSSNNSMMAKTRDNYERPNIQYSVIGSNGTTLIDKTIEIR